ncbi:MAG: sporulation protein YunB, partial [Oscillospiraceae bacterium]|nr:sporulation protein YunB [Oscillospiraceae bacterium]
LSQLADTELSIPVGTLTGSPLLAGRGPRLKVRMQTVGVAGSDIENEFTAAGINQTKHRIILTVEVRVSILLPGYTTYTTAGGSYEVAETVIVGQVPETYTYFHADEMEESAKEYIMNNG